MKHFVLICAALWVSCHRVPPPVTNAAETSSPEATVAASVAFTEGPTVDDAGDVYFTETVNARIMKYSPSTRRTTVFREQSNRANGLLFDMQGRLIACEGSDAQKNEPRVTRTDMKTGRIEVLADRYEGLRFNAPNDVTMDSKGRLYFTDPAPDSTSPIRTSSAGKVGIPGVYRIDTDGKGHAHFKRPGYRVA